MGLVLIRRPSDTPTVDGFDDARILHYAVGGRRGLTKNYGSECNLSASGNTLTVGAGEIVVDGWQTVVDASGESVSVGGVPTGAYISVYAEFNMTAAESPIISIKTAYDTNDYPVISGGDDLISNPRGIANLVLWTCKKTASGVDTLARVASILSLEKDEIAEINRRLDELGFKTGSINLADGVIVARNDVYRLGRAVYIFLYLIGEYDKSTLIGTIPKEFAPAREYEFQNLAIKFNDAGDAEIRVVYHTGSAPASGSINFGYNLDDVVVGEKEEEYPGKSYKITSAEPATYDFEYTPNIDIKDTIVSINFDFTYGDTTMRTISRIIPIGEFGEIYTASIFSPSYKVAHLYAKKDDKKIYFRLVREIDYPAEPDTSTPVDFLLLSVGTDPFKY